MKLIFIRGLPGSGESYVAESLTSKLENCAYVKVDDFKLGYMKSGASIPDSRRLAYAKTISELQRLQKQKKDYVVVEELMCDPDFVRDLQNFARKTNSQSYWFRLKRSLTRLLETESRRDRRVKNSLDDFRKLEEDIGSCPVEGEIIVENNSDNQTAIKQILERVR